MIVYRSAPKSVGRFPEYLRSNVFKINSGCLLKVFRYLVALLCNINFYEHPKLNYDTVMDRDVTVTRQVERAAQVLLFRFSTIIRELVLNLSKVIFTSKHSVKLHSYLLCGCVAACHGMTCVTHAIIIYIINNDVISPNVLI